MEPVTHALTSIALSRAGLERSSRLAVWILLAGGLLPDLDLFGLLLGPRFALRINGTLTHSLLGVSALVVLIALVFSMYGKKFLDAPIRFSRALLLAAVGAAAHLLLDLTDSYGVQLFWPFYSKWYAWFFTQMIDPWILILLIAGLLLPGLFRLVSEEIGERKRSRASARWAIAALALLGVYVGARGVLHARAIELLLGREYHGSVPFSAGAFPSSASMLTWHGVVATANTLEEVEVPFGPASYFDPDRSLTHYKPEPSPALDAAENSDVARRFLLFARFPLAGIEKTEDGYHFELRDLRFASSPGILPTLVAVVDLNSQLQVTHQEFRFEDSSSR
jgi:inner membrane protein